MKVALKEYFIDKEYNLIYLYNTRALRDCVKNLIQFLKWAI